MGAGPTAQRCRAAAPTSGGSRPRRAGGPPAAALREAGTRMSEITREQLHAYLDDALSDAETARVEQALRDSEVLRRSLRQAMQERDRGEHSLGAIWRR